MAYTYRFKDINNNVIYVGFTGQTMAERMNQHFTKGHLPAECYKSVADRKSTRLNSSHTL